MPSMIQAPLSTPHGPPRRNKLHSLTSAALMALLAVIILATAYSLVVGVRELRMSGRLAAHRHLRDILTHALTVKPDIASVSDWMTFDYLDQVFKLPPTYLKDTLNIADARYPRLSIRRYAGTAKLNDSVTVLRVQAAIRNYQTTPTTTKP